jgi:hypothetical protein
MCHRTVRCTKRSNGYCTKQSSTKVNSAAPDCPVHQEVRAPTIETVRTLTVGWRGWLTGLSGAPINSSLPQQLNWWLGAINTPQPPPLQPSKHSQQCIQYKSKTQHSKTQIKASDPIKVHNSTLVFRTCEKIDLCSFVALVCLVGFLLPLFLFPSYL